MHKNSHFRALSLLKSRIIAIRPIFWYAVADALVRYTVKQAVGVLFGDCELRAKELDFLMALTDRAGRVVK